MKRRLVSSIALLLCLTCSLFFLSGCKKGGSGLDTGPVKDAIAAKIEAFKSSVESYDVEGMLAFLAEESNFEGLYITEGNNQPYAKNYATLRSELEEDEQKQLAWRQPAPEGKGYVLTMELGAITYSNVSQSGAVAGVGFTIKEKADEISELVTDTGTMVCTMVKTQGDWRCKRMNINYAVVEQRILFSGAGVEEMTGTEAVAGFGLGSLLPED